jgi:DNA-binding winged helix-turn-helix (wHTH) protein
MTEAMPAPEIDSEVPPGRVCRFQGVELRLDDFVLIVDGRPRACSRKAFELIWVLCRQPRRTRTRDALIAEVWPGGQIVSDEALAQVVFRARNVLGPYGDLVKTVRGVGFALDADVEQTPLPAVASAPLAAVQPAAALPQPEPATAPADEVPFADLPAAPLAARASHLASGRRAGPALAALALLLLLAGWLLLGQRPAPAPDIDDGYGFTMDDLAATHGDTPALFAEALTQDARGDRARAIALMRIAHETDAATPLPALMLALWSAGSVDQTGVQAWMKQADPRIGSQATPLVRLFRDYVAASADIDSQQVVATAGAILGLRPKAWRMRHARAHLLEYRGMRHAALEELRQVEFAALGHRKRDLIIADLASFGDPDAAERILARLAGDPEQATWQFLSARVAWTRQDWDGAILRLRQSREQAHRKGRMDLQWRALIHEAVASVVIGRTDEAIAAAEQARALMSGSSPIDALDMSMLLAGLRAERGQQDLVAEDVAQIRRLLPIVARGDSRVSAWMLLLRLSHIAPGEGPEVAPGSAHEALWRAARQADAGDLAAARESLTLAVERGVAATRLWDEARYLQARLGLPVGAEQPLDPPYAPLARVVLRRALAMAAAGDTVGGYRPDSVVSDPAN